MATSQQLSSNDIPANPADTLGQTPDENGALSPLDLLFDHFDQLVTHPADIPRLREMILQLAVQGKLVPQDPDDEPASELIKRIAAKKEILVTQKEIRRQKPSSPISDEEVPFSVPENWQWVRLNDLCFQITDGVHKTPTYVSQGIPFISVNNFVDNKISFQTTKFISREEHEDLIKRCHPQKGDVLMGKVGSIGVCDVVETDDDFSIFVQIALLKNDKENVDSYYLRFGILSPVLQNQIYSKSSGTALQYIGLNKISELLVPLPPLAEQKRIVAKVESLLAQLQQLEAELAAAEQAQITLNQAALHHLLTSPTPAETQARWDLIAANFDLLYSDPANIDDLKQAILQLAVQGKLVPQDPTDEPASVLLECIAAEKERLVEEGKIKKSKPLPPVGEDEIPYEVPEGWEWVRLDSISDIGTGSTPLRSNGHYYDDGTIPWVTSSATNEIFVEEASEYITELAVKETRLRIYPEHTLIVALYGQGKTRGQISELLIEATINQACAAIVFEDLESEIRPFIKLFFLKNYQDLRSLAEGGAQPNLNVGKVKSLCIPLPPLAEQKRIVTKVEALLGQCEALQSALAQAGQSREKALAAVVNGVVG